MKKFWHIENLLYENWVERISIQQKLHEVSPFFPRIEYRLNNQTGVLTQTIPVLESSIYSRRKDLYGNLIEQLNEAVSIMPYQ